MVNEQITPTYITYRDSVEFEKQLVQIQDFRKLPIDVEKFIEYSSN
jgi:hypothetical protein